jgi:hypothetical protein
MEGGAAHAGDEALGGPRPAPSEARIRRRAGTLEGASHEK